MCIQTRMWKMPQKFILTPVQESPMPHRVKSRMHWSLSLTDIISWLKKNAISCAVRFVLLQNGITIFRRLPEYLIKSFIRSIYSALTLINCSRQTLLRNFNLIIVSSWNTIILKRLLKVLLSWKAFKVNRNRPIRKRQASKKTALVRWMKL